MTEVTIPDGWRTARLSELCEKDAPIMYGILQPGPEIQGGVPYVRPTEIDDDRIKLEEIRRTSPQIAAQYRRAALRTGDLLITIVGTLGKIAVVPPELNGANITQSSARIRLASKIAHPAYVRQILRSPVAIRQYDYHRLGTGVPRLNIHHVRDLKIPLPPLADQRRIAEVLDRAEALRAKRRATLAQLDSLSQSIFLDLFGDPVTNPKGWRTEKLSAFCDLMNGFAFKSSDYVQESQTLNCRMSNIRPNGQFDVDYHPKYLPDDFAEKYKSYVLRDGDVIIAMTDMATKYCIS